MEHIHLSGAEDVRNASHTIRSAAEEIRQAAGSMQEIERPIQSFGEFVQRFENAVACLGEIEGMKAENAYRESTGQSRAYAEEAFHCTLVRYGMRQS